MSSEASQVESSTLSSVAKPAIQEDENMTESCASQEDQKKDGKLQHVILFYKYHPLSSSHEIMEPFRLALENLCKSLSLMGRILVGCSDKGEGINGTLAGNYSDVRAFTLALLGREYCETEQRQETLVDEEQLHILKQFWKENQAFAQSANIPPLYMTSPDDFKWSSCESSSPLFPDLNIKLVKELIGTGGLFSSISIEETSKGYLTPQQWHEALSSPTPDTIVIDCRNTKECSIGHFEGSLDPKVTTFAQFPHWVQQNKSLLQNKKVLMSCTGGIRCEKASAFIRREVQDVKEVKHLKGGVHKYLEQYGKDGLWKGKNFVFDGRGAAGATETKLGKEGAAHSDVMTTSVEEDIVGKCIYCQCPYDTFDPERVCTVCREPTLVCPSCKISIPEYHCFNHWHLRTCYFTNLGLFSQEELTQQLTELESHLAAISVGRRYKQKRKTLQKQCLKVQARLNELRVASKEEAAPGTSDSAHNTTKCRNCGDVACSGSCWGFHGLKRKEMLEKKSMTDSGIADSHGAANKRLRPPRQKTNHRASKQLRRQHDIEEIQRLHLSLPPSAHRDADTGVRVPPPCTRVLQTSVKGKWCGRSARSVMQEEFMELSNDAVLNEALDKGLLRVNGEPLSHATTNRQLKNMDMLSRIVHWHEAPVTVPPDVVVQKVPLPADVCEEYHIDGDGDNGAPFIYVCDKPSSVPVHPAGPYLSNTLTLMVEAQEKLDPRSLIPCHRIDRVTSGLTLCCTNVGIARLVQSKIDEGAVMKLYLAAVQGRFPRTESDLDPLNRDDGNWSWCSANCVQVDAPVELKDAKNGIRTVSSNGKPSQSRFRFLAYDSKTDTSLVACCPVTGRGHQLRVHLQWLGFPICNDVQYGGQLMEDNGSRQKDAVIRQMTSSIEKEVIVSEDAGGLFSIQKEEAQAAKEACCCCRDGQQGVEASFTPAQLLQSGHSIRLHALRYRIPILPKRRGKTKKMDEGSEAPLAVIEMAVQMPDWAICYGDIEVPWLQDASGELT